MYCKNCGQNIADDAAFCGFCGATVTPEPSSSDFFTVPPSLADDAQPSYSEPAFNTYAPASPFAPVDEPPKAPRRSKKKFWIIGGIAAVVAVAVLVLVLVLNSSDGPLSEIFGAVEKTVDAGSFSVEVEYYYDGRLRSTNTIEAKCNPDKKELTLVIRDDDDDFTAIYDGQCVEGYTYDGRTYAYAYDVSEQLDVIFDYYGMIDLGDLSDTDLSDLLDDLDLPRSVVREIEDAVDLDKAQDGFETVMGWLNDEDWLRENLGFEKSEKGGITTYSFECDSRDLRSVLKEILKAFESALDDDVYDELRSSIGYIDSGYDFTLTVSLDGKYLSSVEISYSRGSSDYTYVFTFEDVGKTKIDTDELDDWLDAANDWDD